jgi:hypothetical protein
MEKSFTIYTVIIIFILLVVFSSQQAYSRGVGKNLISAAANQAGAYLSKGADWVMSNVYPKITGEVQKRGDMIKTEVKQEKEKVSENILTKVGNYFSGVANNVLHPDQNNNCQTAACQTTAGQ